MNCPTHTRARIIPGEVNRLLSRRDVPSRAGVDCGPDITQSWQLNSGPRSWPSGAKVSVEAGVDGVR